MNKHAWRDTVFVVDKEAQIFFVFEKPSRQIDSRVTRRFKRWIFAYDSSRPGFDRYEFAKSGVGKSCFYDKKIISLTGGTDLCVYLK